MKERKQLFQKAISVLLVCLTVVSVCLSTVYAAPETESKIGVDYPYPKAEVMQVDIVMQPSCFLKMVETPISKNQKENEKKMYDASVSINAESWQDVGIRLRGNPEYDYPGKRLPFEICFDHVQPNGAYHNNPTLKFIKCHGPAFLFIEIIAMAAYRFMNIPTPEMTPAVVRINGEYFGQYLAVEDINEAFIQKYYDGSGSLYRGDTDSAPRTGFSGFRTKVDHGDESIDRLSDAINKHKPIDAFLDVDEFLRFMACEAFTFDNDGFFVLNNYFLYDNLGQFVLLPWDKDLSFQCFNRYDGFAEKGILAFEPLVPEQHPIIYTLLQNASYKARYYGYITELNDQFLGSKHFLPWLQNYISVLSPYLQKDPTTALYTKNVYDDLTSGNILYANYHGNLLLSFQTIHQQLQNQLQGQMSSYQIPDDCEAGQFKINPASYFELLAKGKQSIRRICVSYWKLRRQFYWQEYGTTTVCIGSVFAMFLCMAIVSTHITKGGFRRRKKREDIWNE